MGGRCGRTFNSVPFTRGRNVDNISSMAAGWKNLRRLSAIYPIYHDIWLHHTRFDDAGAFAVRRDTPNFKLSSTKKEIVVKNTEQRLPWKPEVFNG